MQNVFVACKGMDGGTQETERLSGGQRPARGHFVHSWIARERAGEGIHARTKKGPAVGGSSLPCDFPSMLTRMLSPDEVEYEARGRLHRRPPSLLLSLFPSVALALPSAPLDVQTLEVVHNAWRLTMTASRT